MPGALGAFAGATLLSSLSTAVAAPVMSLVLLALGLYIFVRLTFQSLPQGNLGKPLRKRFLSPLGLLAGFVDATGGGGWGPVGTPAILASGRLEPRKVIGSVDASEFLVAVAASAGFIVGIGSQGLIATWGHRPADRWRRRGTGRGLARGATSRHPATPHPDEVSRVP